MIGDFVTTVEVKRYALAHDITFAEAYDFYAAQGCLMGQVDRYHSDTPPFPTAPAAPIEKEILI